MLACQQQKGYAKKSLLTSIKFCCASLELKIPNFRFRSQNKKVPNGSDALAMAKASRPADAVAFVEFVLSSEVAKVLLDEFKFSRRAVVAFYDDDLVQKFHILDGGDLWGQGVDKPLVCKRFLNRPNPLALTQKRDSFPMRVAKRVSGTFSKLPVWSKPTASSPTLTPGERILRVATTTDALLPSTLHLKAQTRQVVRQGPPDEKHRATDHSRH